MGKFVAQNLQMPGTYGLNSQSDIADDQLLRYASTASNAIVGSDGKLSAREDFVLQTTGFSGTVNNVYTHRLNDGTELVFSASAGQVYSGITTMTSRFDYRAGSQIVDVGGAKAGATATGLANDATNYTYLISTDGGANQTIAVTGSTAQTYTNLVTQINNDVTGGSCSLVGGNLKFVSSTNGASSSISLTSGGGGTNLLTTLTSFVAVRTASAGTAAQTDWQFASLVGKIVMAQAGQMLTVLDEADFSVTSHTNQPWTSSPNIIMAADGRLWAADDAANNVRYKVWWSDLLSATKWSGGDAGSLDVRNVWPDGADFIVALEFLSTRLVILGRYSILLYTLPATHNPASMSLTDTVENIGCVARDSVKVVNGDLYFLSDSGVYRIPKLANVTSLLTMEKVSSLVEDDLISDYASETLTAVRAGFFPTRGWYVLNAPVANKTWVFHTKRPIPQINVPVVTNWTNVGMPFRGFCFDKSGKWYCAGTNGIYKYTGYTTDGANSVYTFDYYSQWLNFGREEQLKHMKGLTLTLEAKSGQTGTARWQGDYLAGTVRTATFTCDSTEFAEDPGIGEVKVALGGSYNSVKLGFTMTPTAAATIHQMRPYVTTGAVKT